ncbi:tetratricopeptide repeat protein [Candidatus Poribacteria bacterium]|nr:tetratricopeptide repeat protein [Candidatus Poribacteria bacterium]
MKKILFFILIIFSLYCSVSYGNDYFHRITMASDGRIKRFPQKTISVYIASPPVPERMKHAYIGDVEYALEQWAGCSEGFLEFVKMESEESDIRVYWTDQLTYMSTDPLGEAGLVESESGGFYVEIYILLQGKPSLRSSLHKEMRVVLLHEIGHSIGLWGHSLDPNDIMYPKSKALNPTRRDKNTLIRLLSSTVNSPYHDTAIKQLKIDIAREPRNIHSRLWLGMVYADKGDDELAVKELMDVLKISPDMLKAVHRLGRIFQKEGMYNKAIDYFEREVTFEPSPGLYTTIGLLYLRQDKYHEAVEYFRKALDMDKEFHVARINNLAAYHLWASELIDNNELDKAIVILKSALDLFPDSRVLNYDIGTAYDAKGQYNDAIKQYKISMELDPEFEAAKSNIASCLNNLGAEEIKKENWEECINLCEEALKWDPNFWEARKNLESATFGLGRHKHEYGMLEEAISYYKTVLNMDTNNVNANRNLGFAFFEKGLYHDAKIQFQRTLELDPESQEALMGLNMVKKRSQIKKAKTAIMLTLISMIVCMLMLYFIRQRRRSHRINTKSNELGLETEGTSN